jgi:pyruvate dehydrogenase E1 component alpha subunit
VFEYRTEEEVKQWEKDDQVKILGKMLSRDDRLRFEKEINNEVASAMKFAEHSPFPGKEELKKHVYK